MLTVQTHTHIRAPGARCFDLARSVDLHVRTAAMILAINKVALSYEQLGIFP